jgi:hypothetical protein
LVQLHEKAAEAAERLGLGASLLKHESALFERLERCSAETTDDLLFVAESLPPIAGLVHFGGTLSSYRNAENWIRAAVPDAEPGSILSALVLLYLTDRALRCFSAEPTRAATWNHIRNRIEGCLQPPELATA